MADKIYRFVQKKEKKFVREFKPVKEKTLSFDSIREIFLATIKKKQGAAGPPETRAIDKNRPVVKSALRSVFLYIGMFILALGLVIGYIIFSLQGIPMETAPTVPPGEEKLDIRIIESGIANVKGLDVYTPYAIVAADSYGLRKIELAMEAADGPMFGQVYVLNSRREQGASYQEFKEELARLLWKDGIVVNEIYLDELVHIPSSANSIIIVPTGYLPAELATSQNKSIVELANKGATIIYIGYGIDQGLMDERRGRIFPGVDYSVQSVEGTLGISTSGQAPIASGLRLQQARYGVTSSRFQSERKPSVKYIYGAVSTVSWGGDGYLLVVPNTLDSGWVNGKAAAADIAKIISEKTWYAEFGRFAGRSVKDSVETAENATVTSLLITPGKEGLASSGMRIYAYGYDANGKLVKSHSTYVYVVREQRGRLGNDLYSLSERLSGKKLAVEVVLNESADKFKQPLPLFITVTDSSGNQISEQFFGTGPILPIREYRQSWQYDPSMSPGRYLLKIEAPTSPRTVLAKSILIVPQVNIEPYSLDWRTQEFYFRVNVPELHTQNERFTQSLADTYVTVDNDPETRTKIVVGKYGNDVVARVVIRKRLAENAEHVFRFDVQSLEYTAWSEISRGWWEQWWFWAGVALTGGIVGIGIMFKAREKIVYSLDIPDFEIRKKKKIAIKSGVLLELFNRINKDYGWEYMPLQLKEIKAGFKKITYQGRPIMIGDYNLQMLLDELKRQGKVHEHDLLYSPSEWEHKSGFDYKYLSMFRRIRDIMINNAVPFTKLGERKDCDIYTSGRKESMRIVIGEGKGIVERLIRAIAGGDRVLLIFADDDSKQSFIERITHAGINSAAIKIAMQSGKIIPLTLSELKSFIK